MTNVEMEMEEVYEYPLAEKTIPKFKRCHDVTTWVKHNLESLVDDNDNTIFSKVNLGYSEDKLKSFTKKATCDVHINTVTFEDDFTYSRPEKINTIIVFKLKGNNNRVAETATILLDYLIQEFATNDTFKQLTIDNKGIVSDTRITNAGIREQPNNSNWYVLGVIELSHHLF